MKEFTLGNGLGNMKPSNFSAGINTQRFGQVIYVSPDLVVPNPKNKYEVTTELQKWKWHFPFHCRNEPSEKRHSIGCIFSKIVFKKGSERVLFLFFINSRILYISDQIIKKGEHF